MRMLITSLEEGTYFGKTEQVAIVTKSSKSFLGAVLRYTTSADGESRLMIVANRHVLLYMLEVHNSSHKNHYPVLLVEMIVLCMTTSVAACPLLAGLSITVSSRQLRRAQRGGALFYMHKTN
jgi:hypothetical protein